MLVRRAGGVSLLYVFITFELFLFRFFVIQMFSLMILVGLGVYGTSSDNPIIPSSVSLWENSMSVTADVLWDIINPLKSDRYVEIYPPVYITIIHPGDPIPHLPMKTSEKAPFGWKITIDSYSFHISPYMFTGIIVIFLLLFTLSCLLVSSLMYIYSKQSSTISSRNVNINNEKNSVKQNNSSTSSSYQTLDFRIVSLMGSSSSDIEYVDSDSLGNVVWGCMDGKLHAWNRITARHVTMNDCCERLIGNGQSFRDHITCISLSLDGEGLLVTGTKFGAVFLWNIKTFTLLGKLQSIVPNYLKSVTTITFLKSSDIFHVIVLFSDGSSKWWKIQSADPLNKTMSFESNSKSFDLSEHGATVLNWYRDEIVYMGHESGTIFCFEIVARQDVEVLQDSVTLRGHSNSVSALCSNTEMSLLASGSVDGEIILWDLSSHTEVIFIAAAGTMSDLCLTPISSASSEYLNNEAELSRYSSHSLWSASSNDCPRPKSGYFDSIASEVLRSPSVLKVNRVYPAMTGHCAEITTLHIHIHSSNSSSDINAENLSKITLVSSSLDETVKLWDVIYQLPHLSCTTESGQHIILSQAYRPFHLKSTKLVHTIHQKGCSVIDLQSNLLSGVRRTHRKIISTSSAGFNDVEEISYQLRNRQHRDPSSAIKLFDLAYSSPPVEFENYWEAWLYDLNVTDSLRASGDVDQVIILGPDHLPHSYFPSPQKDYKSILRNDLTSVSKQLGSLLSTLANNTISHTINCEELGKGCLTRPSFINKVSITKDVSGDDDEDDWDDVSDQNDSENDVIDNESRVDTFAAHFAIDNFDCDGKSLFDEDNQDDDIPLSPLEIKTIISSSWGFAYSFGTEIKLLIKKKE
jgi:WD40 repeat protein